ncbi:MAG TPA: DUF4139 domain-containing protein [Caulobacteraceae bacterium]|jgi:hypothetical protein
MRWLCLVAAVSAAGAARAAEPARRPKPAGASVAAQPVSVAPRTAPSPPEEPKLDNQRLSITIYNGGQALVQDVRSLDLPAGRRRIELREVSNQIEPASVSLAAPDLAIVEQNFDFDLLTPSKLMEKAVGKQVQIVRTNPGNGQQVTETATVLAANGGVVLKIGDRIEVLRDDGAPTRVIFDGVPENLRARPTLSVTVDSTRAGRRDATLTYLTRGLNWHADYVAVFDEKASKLDFQGWITLINQTSTTFADVKTELVAGSPQSGGGFNPNPSPIRGVVRGGGETPSNANQVGDTYFYPLKEPTTIAANQQKQVGFIEADQVAAQRVYQFRTSAFQSQTSPSHVDSVLQFSNSRSGGLAAPLPAGVVRIYMRDADGALKLIGESAIGHTPQGSDLSLRTGEAFDVTVQPTAESEQTLDKRRNRHVMSYLVRNAKDQPVTVQLRQGTYLPELKVVEESIKSRRVDASEVEWAVPVPAGGETKLTFTVEESR